MTTSRRNTIMSWMAYTEFFYPGCELQPGYFYLSIPELYYIPEDGACIGAAGVGVSQILCKHRRAVKNRAKIICWGGGLSATP